VKTIPTPKTKKESKFAKGEEACRKDIERAKGQKSVKRKRSDKLSLRVFVLKRF
jgi:hypothetical protein